MTPEEIKEIHNFISQNYAQNGVDGIIKFFDILPEKDKNVIYCKYSEQKHFILKKNCNATRNIKMIINKYRLKQISDRMDFLTTSTVTLLDENKKQDKQIANLQNEIKQKNIIIDHENHIIDYQDKIIEHENDTIKQKDKQIEILMNQIQQQNKQIIILQQQLNKTLQKNQTNNFQELDDNIQTPQTKNKDQIVEDKIYENKLQQEQEPLNIQKQNEVKIDPFLIQLKNSKKFDQTQQI